MNEPMSAERLTEHGVCIDPWEACGQDNYCRRDCHEPGGCTNGCKVPKLYWRLYEYEEIKMTPDQIKAMLAEVERLQTSKAQKDAMYVEACEDRRTMGEEIERLCVENARIRTENDVMFNDLCRARKFGDETAHLMSAAIETREKVKDALRKQISHTLRARKQRDLLTAENARLRAELEAAKRDLHELAQCVSCKHSWAKGMRCKIPSKERISTGDGKRCHTWEWRGVPANTPAQGATDETRGGGEG